MINEIKNIVLNNKKALGLKNFSIDQIKVSKFFHGRPSTSNKVLFFVSIKNNPTCVIKMVRSEKDNDLINREIEGIKYFESINMRAPKILSIGEINKKKYLCQSIITGTPIGRDGEKEAFSDIAEYHLSVPRGRKIKIENILAFIKLLKLPKDDNFSKILSVLAERKDDEVYIANQHGDLTYKNLIRDKTGQINFIDFENFGLRSIWGIDITHYMIRMFNSGTKVDISSAINNFVSRSKKYRERYNLDISDDRCADLFLLDMLFESLKKTFFSQREEIIPLVKNIWSEEIIRSI